MKHLFLLTAYLIIGCYSLAQDSVFIEEHLVVNDSISQGDSVDITLLTDVMEMRLYIKIHPYIVF